MTNQAPLVLISLDELKAIVTDAVRAAIGATLPSEPARYLDTKEAAEFLGVHPDTLGRMVRTKAIAATRIGREYRFKREDLTALDSSGR